MAWGLGLDRRKTWEPPMDTDKDNRESFAPPGIPDRALRARVAKPRRLRGRPGMLSKASRVAPATWSGMPRWVDHSRVTALSPCVFVAHKHSCTDSSMLSSVSIGVNRWQIVLLVVAILRWARRMRSRRRMRLDVRFGSSCSRIDAFSSTQRGLPYLAIWLRPRPR